MRISPGSHDAPCSMTPTRSSGNRSSTPSMMSTRQRLHHRVRDRHVVDRAEVVVAAVEVGDGGQAVLEVRRDRAAGRRRRRGTRSGCRASWAWAHSGIETDVAGRVPGRAGRRRSSAPRTPRRAPRPRMAAARSKSASGTYPTGSSRSSTAQKSTIARLWARARPYAKSRSSPCSTRCSVSFVNVLNTSWLTNAEQVEHRRPVLGDERAGGLPVLAQPDLAPRRRRGTRGRRACAGSARRCGWRRGHRGGPCASPAPRRVRALRGRRTTRTGRAAP